MTELSNQSIIEARIKAISALSPCDFADALAIEQFVNPGIVSLWQPSPKIVGRAFTVDCPQGDHLMFHAAIYRAAPGDIIVAKGDPRFALAGGNVCAIAKSRGIAGFIVDGMVRDLAEIRAMEFAVFARGVIPKPGAKKQLGHLNGVIDCGGVSVSNGDYVVADEEGIAIIPEAEVDSVIGIASARAHSDANTSLNDWQKKHQQTVQNALNKLGFTE